jgi:hypothetical protein
VTAPVSRHAPFELLRFAASAVSADLGLVEVAGRFRGQRGRFARQPVLVIEDRYGDRHELTPVRSEVDDERWTGVYAAPVSALDGEHFALGVRGALLELPEPDELDPTDRLAALAREANGLRRRVEALEAELAAAHAETEAISAKRDAAVTEARETAEAAAAQRIADLEREVVEAHRLSAADVAEARRDAEAEHRLALEEVQRRAHAAEEAAAGAEERARVADERAYAEAAGVEVLRAELAEERDRAQAAIAELQQRLGEARSSSVDPTRPLAVGRDDEDEDEDPTTVADPEDEPEPLWAAAPPRPARPGDLPGRTPPPPPPELVRHGPDLSPWFAVFALVVVAVVLLVLLGVLG